MNKSKIKLTLKIIAVVLCVLLPIGAAYSYKLNYDNDSVIMVIDDEPMVLPTESASVVPEDTLRNENTIYSFLQGPRAWEARADFSGSWGEMYMDEGDYFGGFGCGLCCIANIYDTLSPYEASPIDVYNYAKDNTSYSPNPSNCAIGWESMLSALQKLGMDARLANKPAEYEDFRNEMSNSETAIILILSDDEDSYWGETGGHYVNIWKFNPADDTVFVANPGSKSKNRKTITLQECYDYLKLVSRYQVLYVNSYTQANDQWQYSEGISEDWVRPDYLIVN